MGVTNKWVNRLKVVEQERDAWKERAQALEESILTADSTEHTEEEGLAVEENTAGTAVPHSLPEESAEEDREATVVRLVKVRFDCTADDINGHLIEKNFSTISRVDLNQALRYAARRAVLEVPAGVPTFDQIRAIMDANMRACPDWSTVDHLRSAYSYLAPYLAPPEDGESQTGMSAPLAVTAHKATCDAYAARIAELELQLSAYSTLGPYLAPLPRSPVDVEALAEVLINAWYDADGGPAAAARAALAHLGLEESQPAVDEGINEGRVLPPEDGESQTGMSAPRRRDDDWYYGKQSLDRLRILVPENVRPESLKKSVKATAYAAVYEELHRA